MYWKHDKEILYSFNFDRIIFIKIHIHEQIVSVLYYFVVLVSLYGNEYIVPASFLAYIHTMFLHI